MVAEAKPTKKKQPLPLMYPIGNYVVIQRTPASDTSKGGIVLPDAVRLSRQIGKVVAVGPGALKSFRDEGQPDRYPLQVRVGDTVIFGAPMALNLDEDDPDTELVIVPEHQILTILGRKE